MRTLSEIEVEIARFNVQAGELKQQRENLIFEITEAGLGARFAQRSLARVTVKMPEGKMIVGPGNKVKT